MLTNSPTRGKAQPPFCNERTRKRGGHYMKRGDSSPHFMTVIPLAHVSRFIAPLQRIEHQEEGSVCYGQELLRIFFTNPSSYMAEIFPSLMGHLWANDVLIISQEE